jgi:hypothetical protein
MICIACRACGLPEAQSCAICLSAAIRDASLSVRIPAAAALADLCDQLRQAVACPAAVDDADGAPVNGFSEAQLAQLADILARGAFLCSFCCSPEAAAVGGGATETQHSVVATQLSVG